jgi:beta-glucosidase
VTGDAPAAFLWGAATSAHQVEGAPGRSDWTEWEAAGRLPHRDSAATGAGHWHRMEEDLGWIEALGLSAYRFSVDWARIEPEPGRIDGAALERYAWLAAACRARGIEPVVTLHHFASPLWFARAGGFGRATNAEIFARFAGRVAARLGRDVRIWITFNEPNVLVAAGYIAGRFPPGLKSLRRGIVATRVVQAAHRRAVGAVRRHAGREPLIGIALQMLEVAPERARNPLERALAALLDTFMNDTWPRDLARDRAEPVLDFIGVNYYTRARLRLSPLAPVLGGETMALLMQAEEGLRSDLRWPVWPEGLERALARAARHGLPLLVTENGIADSADALRPDFLRAHLAAIARARQAGADVRGYFHWSLLDNWEWLEGYEARFGLLEVDRATLARRPRASAFLYRDIIARHRRGPPDPALLARERG